MCGKFRVWVSDKEVYVNMTDYKKTKTYREIKKSLLEQLENNGNGKDFFIDLVNDYMALWVIKCQLIDDIAERGVTCKYQNGNNQWGYKKNDSINELNKTNTQMLKILQQLNIKANVVEKIEEDDDEL